MEDLFLKGGEEAILLLHSLTHTPQILYYVANTLHKSGYTVYAPVFRGHDREKIIDVLKVDASDWFEDGALTVDYLKTQGYQSISVVGQSLGGMVALDRLLNDQTIERGVIISAPSEVDWHHEPILEEVEERVKQDAKDYHVPSLSKETQAAKIKMKRLLKALDIKLAQMSELYESIGQEVLIFAAEDDPIVPFRTLEHLSDQVPNATLISYETEDHLLSVSRYNQQLVDEIISFLN